MPKKKAKSKTCNARMMRLRKKYHLGEFAPGYQKKSSKAGKTSAKFAGQSRYGPNRPIMPQSLTIPPPYDPGLQQDVIMPMIPQDVGIRSNPMPSNFGTPISIVPVPGGLVQYFEDAAGNRTKVFIPSNS